MSLPDATVTRSERGLCPRGPPWEEGSEGGQSPPPRLDIEIGDVERVFLDEIAARLDRVAHEDREHLIGAHSVLHRDLEQRPRLRVHRRVRELLRVHLAEPLVSLERRARLRVFE